MDGLLNINKPAGQTSYDIVAMVKRLTHERHTGHAGTLDPNATGVLPICLGKGTRIIEFLMDTHKIYRAVIELGISTDTFDAEGKVTRRGDAAKINRAALEKALDAFRGDIQQTPPMYSALKHQGQPLYELAREGINVERKSRPITVHRLELMEWQSPLVTLEIECSKGTYIRSIANDLGEALGCGAHLKNLERSGYGIFKIEDAVTPEQLEAAVQRGELPQYLQPIDSVLGDLPAVTVDEAGEKAIKTGNPPAIDSSAISDVDLKYCRAYSADGRFLAILMRDKEASLWRPKKVFVTMPHVVKLVNEDENGAYSGVKPEFLKKFALKESNPNFDVYDSKDGSNRFIAGKCSRLPDEDSLTAGFYGINFHRAKPGFDEAVQYRNEFPKTLWSQYKIHEFAFAASTPDEYQTKSSVWEKFYSYVWGESPLTIWVTPHSGTAARTPDADFPYPALEMDAFVAGAAARCALNNKQTASKRTMISVHSHNWLGAIFDLGGFGIIEKEKLSTIAAEIEEKYHNKVQSLADGCIEALTIQTMRWLVNIKETRGTINPQELGQTALTDAIITRNVARGLVLYGINIKDYTLEEFKTAFDSLHGREIQVASCNHIFAAELIGKELDLRGKIDQGLMNTALQIECMKYCLKKNPELMSEIILDIAKNL